nr:hypothetical protein [Tanacetum cinerariifolium]
MFNIFNVSNGDFLEDLFPSQPSGNPTFSLHPELTSPEVNHDIFDSEGCNALSEKLPDLDSTKDLHPLFHYNPLSGSTTYFSNSWLKEFADELPPEYNDNLQFYIESDLKEIEFLLYQNKDPSIKDSIDQKGLANLADIFGEKIKESKLLIDELDLPCDFLPPSDYDSFISQYFSRVNALPSTNNEDKIFNPGILIQEKPVKIITRVVQDKKLAISNVCLVLEDFDPPFYEPLFFKEVPKSNMLLPFSSENEEKVFKPWIYTSEKGAGAAGYRGVQNRVGYANPDVDEQPVQDLTLNVDNVFQADDCDAFDSNDSDILSEVHDHDHYQDAVCEHHEVHEMHGDVQPNYIVDSYTDDTSNSNMIPYDLYVKDNAVPVVQSNVSTVPNDAYMMILNDMHEPPAQHVSVTPQNKVVDKSLTAELETYKEQVELYERRSRFELTEREQKIDEQLRIVITDRNIKEENLKKELHSVKIFSEMHDAYTVIQARCLKLESELSKLKDKIQKDDHDVMVKCFSNLEEQHLNLQLKCQHLKENLGNNNSLPAQDAELANLRNTSHHDNQEELINHFSKLEVNHLNLQSKYQNLKDSFGNNPPTPDKDTPDFDSVFVIGKMQASLQGKDNVIRQLKKQISQLQVTRTDTDRTLKVRPADSQITKLTGQVTNLQAQNNLFRAENDKIKQHYKELYDSIKITRAKHIEQVTAVTTENVNLKAQTLENINSVSKDQVKPTVLARGKHAIDVEPIVPRLRNNRDTHLDYLKHLKKSVETIRDIVEEAKVALNNEINNLPTFLSLGRSKLLLPNHLIRVNSCPNASGSQPKSKTKTNRISPAKGVNKLPVEDQPRTN